MRNKRKFSLNLVLPKVNHGDKPGAISIVSSGNFSYWCYATLTNDCGHHSQGLQ